MFLTAVLNVILGFSSFFITAAEDLTHDEITKLYKELEIIPDLFKSEAPKNIVKCTYKGDRDIDFGTNLTLLQSINQPEHCEWPTEEGAYYILMLLGLDCPHYHHPYEREFNHWLVVNIPETRIEEGDTIAEYQGGQFDYEPGTHRLVFLVYKQPGKLDFSNTPRAKAMGEFWDRVLFTHTGFSRKHKLGKGHASNFFYMRFNNSQDF